MGTSLADARNGETTMTTLQRQPDETICFACGVVVKRDVRSCPNCGKAVAVEPATVVYKPSNAFAPAPAVDSSADVIGAGRYIINFLLASFVGLGISYALRKQGWLATWISLPVGIMISLLVYQMTQP